MALQSICYQISLSYISKEHDKVFISVQKYFAEPSEQLTLRHVHAQHSIHKPSLILYELHSDFRAGLQRTSPPDLDV